MCRMRRSGNNNTNWGGALCLKRPRDTDWTLQLNHINAHHTTTASYYRRGNYESYTRSSLQIALRTSCARTRETDWTLQLNHIIGEAIMKVTKDHLSKLLSERAAHVWRCTLNGSSSRVQDETVRQ